MLRTGNTLRASEDGTAMAVLSEEQGSGVRSPGSAPLSPSLSLCPSSPTSGFKIQLADRLTKLPPYVLARVNALRDQKRKAGQDVIDLGMADITELNGVISVIKKAMGQRIGWMRNRYFTQSRIHSLNRRPCQNRGLQKGYG